MPKRIKSPYITANNVRKYRKARGWSTTRLSFEIATPVCNIEAWERQKYQPNVKNRAKLLKVFEGVQGQDDLFIYTTPLQDEPKPE